MKKGFMPWPALVITLGLMVSVTTPAAASKGDHFKGLFKGLGTEVYWSIYDENTGVYTDIWMYAVNELYQNPPGNRQRSRYASVSIFQYRYDADEYIPLRDIYYYGPLLPESLSVHRSLSSASLDAYGLEGWQWDYTLEMGAPVVIDIIVNWSAIGPVSNHNSHYHSRSRYGIFNYHSGGKSRAASALGEIFLDGDGMMLDAPGSAYIYSAKEGYIEIIR